MQFGPDHVIQCPQCGFIMSHHSMLSGNTFGGDHWSDAWSFYPMLIRNPEISRCYQCRSFYRLNDALVIGLVDGDECFEAVKKDGYYDEGAQIDPAPAEWMSATRIWEPMRCEYLMAVEQGFARVIEEEINLRILAFWECNHYFRRGMPAVDPAAESSVLDLLDHNLPEHPRKLLEQVRRCRGDLPISFQRTDDDIDNMRKLILLLDNSPKDRIVFKAELYRELGEFDQCSRLIQFDDSPFGRAILEKSESRDCLLFMFSSR